MGLSRKLNIQNNGSIKVHYLQAIYARPFEFQERGQKNPRKRRSALCRDCHIRFISRYLTGWEVLPQPD
jgi:hypothetical protein